MAVDKVVRDILKDLKKELGNRVDMSVMGDEQFAAQPKEWVSTGITLLDRAIRGGLPVGRIVEIFGSEVTGKSALIASIIGQVQKQGGITALADSEQAWSTDFVRIMGGGANVDDIYYLDPDTLEDWWAAAELFLAKANKVAPNRLCLLALDSLAGLPTKEEEETEFDMNTSISKAARVNKLAMRKLRKKLAQKHGLLVFSNQEIARPGAPSWGEKTTTSGGGGPKYFSSVRLKLEHYKKIVKNEELIGMWVQATVYKNRFDASGRKVQYPIYFKTGIDDVESVVSFLYRRGELGTQKGWVTFGGKKMRLRELTKQCREDANRWAEIKTLAVSCFDRSPEEAKDEDGEEESAAA